MQLTFVKKVYQNFKALLRVFSDVVYEILSLIYFCVTISYNVQYMVKLCETCRLLMPLLHPKPF